jgi:acetyl esterase/lipase
MTRPLLDSRLGETRQRSRVSPRRAFIGALVVAITSLTGAAQPTYSTHDDLSYYLADDGSRQPIRTSDDWQHRRADIIAGMEQVMGPLPRPDKPVALDVQVIDEQKEGGYTRRKLAYHTDDAKKTVHSWLLLPRRSGSVSDRSEDKKLPAILCLHQTNTQGKDSPVGLSDRPTLHYALELTKRGYVTLSPDYPSFGEQKDYDFEADSYISGTMKAIYDNMRAIDVLQSLPEVDPGRIGCIGHSLGGHNTLFTAAFDERIKAAVTSCGFTSFHKYKGGNLTGWTSPRYMPLIKTKYNLSPDRMSFDFAEVLAAIAPRAVFAVAPLHDDNFEVTGVKDCLTTAQPIFKLLGHPEHLQAVHPDTLHEFPDAEREQAYSFFDKALK